MLSRFPLDNQKGVALVAAVAFAAILMALAGIYSKTTIVSMKGGKGYTHNREAFYIAMAGIEHALSVINHNAWGVVPGEEVAASGMSGVLANLLTNHSELIGASLNGGTYTVTIQDNDDNDGDTSIDSDNILVLTSTGTKKGKTSIIEALIERPLFKPVHAFTSGQDLYGDKTFSVTGKYGGMHANDDYSQNEATATIAKGVTAYDLCNESTCLSGKRVKAALPEIKVSSYKSFCDYIMKSNGTATDGAGNVIANPTSTTGWVWDWPRWKNGGNNIKKGMYYFETKVETTDTFYDKDSGSGAVNITILSTSHIDMGGTATLQNYRNAAHTEDIQNLFMVSEGGDVELHGGMTVGSSGNYERVIIAAGDEVRINGTLYLKGYAVSRGGGYTWDNSPATIDRIDRNVSLVYDGYTTGPFPSDKITVLSWQEK